MFVVLGRLGWLLVVVVAMALITRGLVATVYFDPTGEALAAEGRGERLVIVACVLLAAAALWCHRRMGAPAWVVGLIASPIVVCGGISLTDAIAVISLLPAYPRVLAGLVGGLVASRGPSAPTRRAFAAHLRRLG